MKKLLFIFLTLALVSFSTARKTKVYTSLDKALKNPEKVIILQLGEYSLSHKKLPESLKAMINLQDLSLQVPKVADENQYGHARHYAIESYQKASLKELPMWLSTFSKLERLSLAGNPNLNKANEIAKLSQVPSLRYLEIHPDKNISDELYNAIGQLTQLKELKIEADRTLKLTELDLLESLLPNCKISYTNYENDRD